MKGEKSSAARTPWQKLSACVVIGLLAAGCGGSNNSTETNNDDAAHDDAAHIESAGRLAITQAELAGVHVIDLDGHQSLATVATNFVPSALYASPSRRYAVAIQRNDDLVQFIDGGLWQEDHVDHLHDYEADPALAALQVNGIRPTHYEVFDDVAALFMDGNAETSQNAAVVSVTDASIESGQTLATLALPMQMHGTAEPRGQYLLSTWRAPTSVNTLPEMVELYRRDEAGYAFVERFETSCPLLHGSFSNERYSAFGCGDGVLVIEQNGDTFSSFKIANPVGMPEGDRIGTVLGHLTMIDWSAARTHVAQTFDHEAANFLVLDDLGMLHVLDASNGWASRGAVAVTGSVSEDHPNASLDAHQIPLAFVPGAVRWLGIAESHDHD